MRNLFLVAVAAITLSLTAASVSADEGVSVAKREVDLSFPATEARLTAQGYNHVRMVAGDPLRLQGFDGDGSHVMVTIDPQTGEIDSSTYFYPMDR